MSHLTLTSVKADWKALITSGAAMSAARAYISGFSGAGVLTQKQFRGTPAVAGPMIVLTQGPATGQQYFVRTFYPTLYLYDDDYAQWDRLNPLADLIEAAIGEEAIAYCQTRYSTGIGAESIDPVLKRPYLTMRYQIKGRF